MGTEKMVGVVVVTHGEHGTDILRSATALVGPIASTVAISIPTSEGREQVDRRIDEAAREVDHGAGVLFLVDLHGSTPANVCIGKMTQGHNVEVLGGVNLAMLLKLATGDRGHGAVALADLLKQTALRSIRLGSETTGVFPVFKKAEPK